MSHTCVVCYDELPAARGIVCRDVGAGGHFTCADCLSRHVEAKAAALRDMDNLADEAAAAEADGNAVRAGELAGRVFCPMCVQSSTLESPCNSDAFPDRLLAGLVSDDVYRAHSDAKTLLPVAKEAKRIFAEAQATVREAVEAAKESVRRGEAAPDEGRLLLERQLREQLPNARQCGRCGYGPVEHLACFDLAVHHGQMSGSTRIDNSCPRCGWFNRDVASWPRWDGRLSDDDATTINDAAATRMGAVPTQLPPPPQAPAQTQLPPADETTATLDLRGCLGGGEHEWISYRGRRGSGKVCRHCYETRTNDNRATWWFANDAERQRVLAGGCPAGGGHQWEVHNKRAGFKPPWMCTKCGIVQNAAYETIQLPNLAGQWGAPVD